MTREIYPPAHPPFKAAQVGDLAFVAHDDDYIFQEGRLGIVSEVDALGWVLSVYIGDDEIEMCPPVLARLIGSKFELKEVPSLPSHVMSIEQARGWLDEWRA